jgi:hypothetical protein
MIQYNVSLSLLSGILRHLRLPDDILIGYPQHTWHNLNQFEGLNILNLSQPGINLL